MEQTNNLNENSQPQFISNKPLGADLFEGKSQEKIAKKISTLLLENDYCKVVGIDGGWGSGKSNLIGLLEKELKKENFVFFIYDTWGYQEDLQRRSILEALTAYLTEQTNILDKEKWDEKLKNLLAKRRETVTESIPRLSIGLLVSALALILTPILSILAEHLNKEDSSNWIQYLIVSAPLIMVFSLLIFYRYEYKSWKKALSKAFAIYQDKQIENTTNETISESEPTVREFRNWIQEISDDLDNKKLILVFDNMDRLPTDKVQQLWSSIHLFFAETKYKNITVIIPFDRQHIINAFKTEDTGESSSGKYQCYGNDFIDKTFNVVYRVSPPILSDWRSFFQEKITEAFGNDYDREECESVLQIYGLLAQDITPRKIIAFINELVSIKHLQSDVPDRYIALFILGKSVILKNPIAEITSPTYLGATDFLYGNNDNLPKYIGALVYQIEAETALQVIYTERLKQALDRNDSEIVETISQSPSFDAVLTEVLPTIENLENAILCLYSLDTELSFSVWNNLYYKVLNESLENQKIKDYQLHLIERYRGRKRYIQYILAKYINTKEFNSLDYYESINKIVTLIEEKTLGLNVFDLLTMKVVATESFISLVEIAKENYHRYKLICDTNSLNSYFSTIEEPEKLDTIEYIPYLKDQKYTFDKFEKHLRELIDNNKDNLENTAILYKRLKEVIKDKPIKNNPLADSDIYTLFTDLDTSEPFYYDLVAMRIAKFGTFSSSYKTYFEDILTKDDAETINRVASVIEYYTTYGDLLLNLETMNTSPLYIAVVNKLIANPVGTRTLSLSSILKKYDIIISKGNLSPKLLINDLNKWERFKDDNIKPNNISTTISSVSFFKDALEIGNELTEYCIETAKEYLDNVDFEKWKTYLENTSRYEIQLSLLFPDYEFTPAMVDAIKYSLERIAKQEIDIENWEDWDNILSKVNSDNKQTVFRNIRDLFCSTVEIDIQTFFMIGDWLFKYGSLDARNESLRRIFKTEIIRDDDCREIISNNKEFLKAILDSTEESEVNDFKSTIREFLDKDDQYASEIAKEIGIRKSRKKEKETSPTEK